MNRPKSISWKKETRGLLTLTGVILVCGLLIKAAQPDKGNLLLFNSSQFITFFIVVYAGYWILQHSPTCTFQNILLLTASYIFYSSWSFNVLGLIIISTLVDYYTALALGGVAGCHRKRIFLVSFSIVFNLSLLGFFKYYNFGIDNFAHLLKSIGFTPHFSTLSIILPIGISFYTFQTMSYVLDVYRREIEPTTNLVDFALYVAFFPQLVAGPIEKASHLLPQIQKKRVVTREDLQIGIFWILIGYFKKMVIADSLAPMVNFVFGNPESVSGVISLTGVFAFTLQAYGDFAGYSLIARGLGRLMGIRLVQNFDRPYLSASPREIWHRWHISLSRWFGNYLYISLGGSRAGEAKTYRNLIITMTIIGLWHGAEWKYIVFGVYWGCILSLNHKVRKMVKVSRQESVLKRIAKIIGTHCLWVFGLLIFRAQNMPQFIDILKNILYNFQWTSDAFPFLIPTLLFYALLIGYHSWQHLADDAMVLLKVKPWIRGCIYFGIVHALVVVGFRQTPYFYFQF